MKASTHVLQSLSAFTAAHDPTPVRTIALSTALGAKLRATFGLSADAPVEDIAAALDEMGDDAREQATASKLVSVPRAAVSR